MASLDLIGQLNLTATNLAPEEDEFAWAGLTRVATAVWCDGRVDPDLARLPDGPP